MPIPKWVAQVNKRVFNKLALKQGSWPVLTHVGRASGETYRTPLEAHPVDGGFIFFAMYGSRSDWVQNILAAGTATLTARDEHYELVSPRLVPRDVAEEQLPPGTKIQPGRVRGVEYLQMDIRR